MSTVIRVENLGKKYLIGHSTKEQFPTFRDAMMRGALDIGRRMLHPLKASVGNPLVIGGSVEDFWALKDVSFEVKQGERIGIIGHNGAGKSTLLKILSRITGPTTGRISLKGRIASLLEVGTGFHPELTGRENIFLNGAILGMSKEEIRRRFDEIVDFAGVEKFLDTPVKRYSSGMRVRLGFSVAAHLEPEILIVDEVLAVGDLKFQKKCLGKMQQVGTEGRTVIFVSHNTGAIGKLCSKVLHMKDGHLASMGDAKEIIKEYTFSGAVHAEVIFKEWFGDRTGNGPMKFEKAAIVDKEGDNSDKVFAGEAFCVKMTLNGPLQKGCLVSISIRNSEDVIVAHVRSPDLYAPSVSESKNEFICLIRGLNVRNDTYFVTLYLEDGIGTLNERLGNCLRFDVHACRTTEFESQGLLQVDDCWRHGIGP